jgi:hypothetical protein
VGWLIGSSEADHFPWQPYLLTWGMDRYQAQLASALEGMAVSEDQ